MLKVRAAAVVDPKLGDGDPVEREVDLAIAAPAQAEAGDVARPDRYRRRAIVAGERLLGAEAADPGRLADDLGGGQRSAAGQAEQGRRERGDQGLDLALERPDGERQLAHPAQDVAGKPGHLSHAAGKTSLEIRQHDGPVQ